MFGKRLATLRKQKGLSQYELAKRLGFTRGQISNYEQGTRQPDFDTLEKIANFFECSVDYLLGRSNDPRLSADEDKEVDKKVKELMEIIESMPEEKRNEMKEKILAYARGLADASKLDKN